VTGGFCGRVLVGLLTSSYGWKVAFAVLAAVNVAAAWAIAALLPREQQREQPPPLATAHGTPVRRLLVNRQLIGTNIVGFCVLFSQVAIFTYVTFHLEAPPYLLSTAALGWLFVVYLVGAAITPVAGRLVDLYGHRAGLTLGMVSGAVGALLTLAPALSLIVIGLALVGTGVFIAQATASSFIGVATREDRGLAVGLYSSAYYLGGTAGGALPSLFWSSGGWTACVLLVVIVQGVTLVTALTFWRPASTVRPD
jgi:predicted MFS family arabinose efflux permease